MNKIQRKFIVVEVLVISLLFWRYHEDQLSFHNAALYTLIYTLCMIGWFYFKD